MGASEDGEDVLISAEPVARRWLLALAGLATLLVVIALSHHSPSAKPTPTSAPSSAVTSRAEPPLHPVSIRSGDAVKLLPGHRATLRVTVSNDNDVPLTLLQVGQGVAGLSLWSVEPTPQRVPPHGTATVVLTFVRYPALACDSAGSAIAVVVTSSDAAVHRWQLPLSVEGRPWDTALAAAACADHR